MTTVASLPKKDIHPGSLVLLRSIRKFKEEAKRRFPVVPDPALDTWPLRDHDALALYDFLDELGRPELTALDIGTFTGFSAFVLALHRNISRVVTVDPNPLLHEQINEHNAVVGKTVDPTELEDLRVLDVARELFDAFPEAGRKIEVVEGAVGLSPSGHEHAIDLTDFIRDGDLVAFVDGLHTAEGVEADLRAVFRARPDAVAILDDCRHAWGPYVQAGVAAFLRKNGDYHFKLLADISASFAQSDLGFVYSAGRRPDVERAFEAIASLYASFDPLVMVMREEELQRTIADLRERLAAALGELQDWRRAMQQMESSLSWRVTVPLRRAKARLRRSG